VVAALVADYNDQRLSSARGRVMPRAVLEGRAGEILDAQRQNLTVVGMARMAAR